ncbi:hypothetical protein ILT44_23100 [Microvirga sp. BT689]|nr:hypothetical protein [Microvirga arvi]
MGGLTDPPWQANKGWDIALKRGMARGQMSLGPIGPSDCRPVLERTFSPLTGSSSSKNAPGSANVTEIE